MPNVATTHTGSSLGNRVSTAARMTREQQAQRDRAADERAAHRRANKRTVTQRSSSAAQRTRAAADAPARQQRTHGRNARSGAEANAKPARSKKAASAQRTRTAPKRRRALAVVACTAAFVVLCAVMLYPVAKPYYAALRDGQRSEAQIQAVLERNEALADSTEALQTDEGIETQARLAYGYVMEGEQSVVVTNVDDSSDSDVPSEVDIDEIEAPSTWYYDILDDVFSYEGA